MLRSLRQGGLIKGLMGVIVVLIIAAFAMDFRGGGISAFGEQDCVVEVDGSCVSAKDYNMLIRLVGPSGASDKELRKVGFTDHAIEALVQRELLLKEAKRLGIAVSEEDLDQELSIGRVHYSWPVDAPLPAALAQGLPYPSTGAAELVTYFRVRNSKTDAFDYDIYRRQIQNLLRMSPREFKERQANEVVAARVRAIVTSPVRVSEDEAFAAFEQEKSQATVRSVSIPKAWFERFSVAPSSADVDAFDKAHTALVDQAWEGSKARWKADCSLLSEITFGVESGAGEEELGEQKQQAEEVLGWLKAGLPFERAAQLFGQGVAAQYGGAVGCFDGSLMPEGGEELGKALEALKAGELSAVVQTGQGFHILKAHGKLAQTEAERLGRHATARHLAIQAAAKERAQALARQLLDKAKAGGDLAAALEEALPGQVHTVALPDEVAETVRLLAKGASDAPEFEISRAFSRSGSPMPGLKQRDVAARVFDLPKADSVLDEVLETYAGYAVVQLKEKTQATREDFDKDKPALMEGLKERKRSEALSRYVARLREKAKKIVINPSFANPPAPEGSTAPPTDATNSG